MAVPRLAWHPGSISKQECPPLLLLSEVSPAYPTGSTQTGRFSDEPFGLRDIQFQRPVIFVEACTFGEEISNFGGTRRLEGPVASQE